MLGTGSSVIPRTTVEAICQHRDRTLARYLETHTALCSARDTAQSALESLHLAAPRVNRFNFHSRGEKDHFLEPLAVPNADEFMVQARKMVDRDVWAHIIELTDLERIMDKTAKDQFHKQLADDPPEVSASNVTATLEQFALDAGTIFKRGIAECFTTLERRFRSHDGWKIGSRVILDRAFNEWGQWSYYTNKRDSLFDVERVFLVLDGKAPKSNGGGIVGQVEDERRGLGLKPRQSEHQNDYFTIRVYKNGNLHIWFRRDDLVTKVNQLLGEYYGEAIPEKRTHDDDTDFAPKTSLAKNYGFFPTPLSAAQTLIDGCPLWRKEGDKQLIILEPSAGTGNLARLLAAPKAGHIVDCVEVHPQRAATLRQERLYRKVTNCDFLALQPTELYDRVVMNPPFDRDRDVDHVLHALRFLKPDGFLAAIMSAGTEFRETKKAVGFRKLITEMNARWTDLPAGSFSEAGTYVNTVILRVWNDRRRVSW